MPYALRWLDDEQSILLISADDRVTWDEYHAINEDALRKVAALPHRVDLILHSKAGLPDGSPLPHFRKVFPKWDAVPNRGLIVVIESSRMSSFIKASVEIAVRLLGFALTDSGTFAATLADAIAYIKADREEKDSVPEDMPPLNNE